MADAYRSLLAGCVLGLPDRRSAVLSYRLDTRHGRLARGVVMEAKESAVVDPDYYWRPISSCPSGIKVQLLNRAGIGTSGKLGGNKDEWFIAWAPMPKIPPEIKALIDNRHHTNIGNLIGD